MIRTPFRRTNPAARLNATNASRSVVEKPCLTPTTVTDKQRIVSPELGVNPSTKTRSQKRPRGKVPQVKKGAASFTKRLNQFLEGAQSFDANAPIVESSQFYCCLLDLAFQVCQNNDAWIELCRHQHWDHGRKKPKPTMTMEPVSWLIRLADLRLPPKRCNTVMRALNVLFSAGYKGERAKQILEDYDIQRIANIDTVREKDISLTKLHQRLLLLRKAKKLELSADFPFSVLRFSRAWREILDRELRDARGGDEFLIKVAVCRHSDGISFRVRGFSPETKSAC